MYYLHWLLGTIGPVGSLGALMVSVCLHTHNNRVVRNKPRQYRALIIAYTRACELW
jgi:hypothetical protein